MKKPFKDTKAAEILSGVLRGAIREIPVVGGVLDNIQNPSNGEGNIDKNQLAGQIIMGGIVLSTVLFGLGVVEENAFMLIVEVLSNLLN